MRADWKGFGVCTSGSTAPPRGATNPASGGAAATSTTAADLCGDMEDGGQLRRAASGGAPASDWAAAHAPDCRFVASVPTGAPFLPAGLAADCRNYRTDIRISLMLSFI